MEEWDEDELDREFDRLVEALQASLLELGMLLSLMGITGDPWIAPAMAGDDPLVPVLSRDEWQAHAQATRRAIVLHMQVLSDAEELRRGGKDGSHAS